MAHSYNGRSLDNSMKLTGYGSVYIFENDEFDRRIDTSTESLGYNTTVGVTFNKETEDRDHTNYDVRTIEETIVTSMAPTADMTFSEFKSSVIAKYLNSKVTKVVGSTSNIELTVTKDNITKEEGFFYIVEGGVDTATITFGTDTPAVAGKHYTIQNGSIAFHSLDRQTALGASPLLDPTLADVEIALELETLDSEVIEFETVINKSYGLYVELYHTFKRKRYMTQLYFHKVTPVIDTLPFKQDDTAAITYDVTFNILASTAITDPTKSKYFKKITTLLGEE